MRQENHVEGQTLQGMGSRWGRSQGVAQCSLGRRVRRQVREALQATESTGGSQVEGTAGDGQDTGSPEQKVGLSTTWIRAHPAPLPVSGADSLTQCGFGSVRDATTISVTSCFR